MDRMSNFLCRRSVKRIRGGAGVGEPAFVAGEDSVGVSDEDEFIMCATIEMFIPRASSESKGDYFSATNGAAAGTTASA